MTVRLYDCMTVCVTVYCMYLCMYVRMYACMGKRLIDYGDLETKISVRFIVQETSWVPKH